MTENLRDAATSGDLVRILLLLGVVLLVGEAVVPGFGILGVTGLACLVLGLSLVAAPATVLAHPWATAVALVVLAGGALLLVGGLFAADRRRQPRAGGEGMVGERGVVRTRLDPKGAVLVRGEIWKARSVVPVEDGAVVVVLRVDGLELEVEPLEQGGRP